jgi:hypothetical protein
MREILPSGSEGGWGANQGAIPATYHIQRFLPLLRSYWRIVFLNQKNILTSRNPRENQRWSDLFTVIMKI